MLGLVVVLPMVMLGALAVFLVAWRGGRTADTGPTGSHPVLRAGRSRNIGAGLTAIAATASLGVVFVLGASVSELSSLDVVVPAAALLVGIVSIGWFAYVPRIEERLAVREASLEVRGVLTFASRRRVVWAIVVAVALMAVVVAFGQIADVGGRSIALTGPFPGWRYGAFTVAALLLLVAAVVVVLVRLSRAPRPSDTHSSAADAALRVAAVDAVLTGFITSATATVGLLFVMAGAATSQAASGSVLDAAGKVIPVDPALAIAGPVELVTGIAVIIIAIASLVELISMLARPVSVNASPTSGIPAVPMPAAP